MMNSTTKMESMRKNGADESSTTGARPVARLRPVHRWIEAQAARSPDAIAVTDPGDSLTFAALDVRANRLGRRLRELGVGPEVLVGISLPRSTDMVVAILAILKAGGAYVPMDPSYPADRLAYLVEDARVPVLLTHSTLIDRLPAGSAAVIVIDRDRGWINDGPADSLDLEDDLDRLAYVIYTSGSTGRPKGAMIHHRGLANYLAWAARTYAIPKGEGAPVHSSIAFDLTVTSMLAPLVAGRRVDLLDEGLGVEQLGEALLRSKGYSLVKITPAHLRALGDQFHPDEAVGRTRAFIIGGEQLTAEHIAFWRENAPETDLINEYGPTETVVGCCIYKVPSGESIEGAIPIGRPIAGTRLYVLDRQMQPVPVGAQGELYIGGIGVARGYLNRPGLTADRFVPDPHSGEPGARLYRTGDLARWRADGQLEYLGRVDHQVKIRGYRVEPGEIEAVLSSHPAVTGATVIAREYGTDDRRLVAYVTGAGAPRPPELREWLLERLPEYMVPSAIVAMEALPLTPNGKVDREALPVPGRSTDPNGIIPPRGPVEEALAEAWAELIGGGPVGVHDNFFEVGGHSLMALQLLARARQVFEVEVSPRDFIEAPTLANLARLVERALAEGSTPAPPIGRADRSVPLPASFAQQRLWFLDQLQPGASAYNVPIAVRLDGTLDAEALRRALEEVIRRHEILRTTFVDNGGIPHEVIGEPKVLELPLDDLSSLTNADEATVLAMASVLKEAARPFDLARGPLVRARLIRLNEERHIVQVTMHHIVSDGWSLGVLIREVSALYEAFRAGEPSPLPEPSIQYADFAVWQRDWLRGNVLEQQLAYWKEQLAGIAPLELPTDRPRPAILSGRGGERTVTLPYAVIEALRPIAREEGATLYMALLTAFQALLHRYSGQEDIAVGSPVAGRSRSETENLIGFFVNTLVLRGDLGGDPGFRELLRRTRRAAIDAYAHQDLPFERLVTALHPDRESGRSPLFQVMFALQNAPLPALRSSDLALTPLQAPSGTAKFDLTLSAMEWPEGLVLTMEYSTDLFDAATVDRMLVHFRILIEAATAEPNRPIGSLPMLTEEERRQVLAGWGAGETDDGWDADDLDDLMADLDAADQADLDALPEATTGERAFES